MGFEIDEENRTIYVSGEDGFGGMYNMILGDGGEKSRIEMLITVVNLRGDDLPRPRDSWIEQWEGHLTLVLYTRAGGGNREAYQSQIDTLRASPYYLTDEDTVFDPTYAAFYFKWPTELPEHLISEHYKGYTPERWTEVCKLAAVRAHPGKVDISEMWRAALEALAQQVGEDLEIGRNREG